jgi:uncharacterized protein
VDVFKVYRDTAGYWRWRYIAGNNRTLADSGEGYANRADCESAIAILKRDVPFAQVSLAA